MSGLGSFLVLAAMLQAPGNLVIRSGDATVSVPVLTTQRGPMVRLEDALQPLGAVLLRRGTDGYRLVAGGQEIDLSTGVAAATIRSMTEQLAAPPSLFEGKLLVPLSLLTDLLPRVTPAYFWDAPTRELRRVALASTSPRPPTRQAEPRRSEATPERPPARTSPPEKRVVVVDAGHGGPDRGMRGPIGGKTRIYEADITLGVSKKLRDALKKRGLDVVMTRTTDTLIALADRGHIANRAKGSVFVSVHVNAANPRWRRPQDTRGFETYFLSTAKTDDERRVEEMENEAVKYEGEEEIRSDDPLSFILNDMKQNEYLRESSDLATEVQKSLASIPHPGSNRGVKQAGFKVLVTAYMPAVLVEIGFGTNPREAAWLSSASGQARIAEAIAEATANYLERLDRRTASRDYPDE